MAARRQGQGGEAGDGEQEGGEAHGRGRPVSSHRASMQARPPASSQAQARRAERAWKAAMAITAQTRKLDMVAARTASKGDMPKARGSSSDMAAVSSQMKA